MEVFKEYLDGIADMQHRKRMEEILDWVGRKFPNLAPRIAWKQPMFTDHGTFIIAFSTAKHHLSVAPEKAGIAHFLDDIIEAGYNHSKELVRIPWDCSVNWILLEKIIQFNIIDKAECTTFWRK